MGGNKRFTAPFAERGNFESGKIYAPGLDALEHKVRFSFKHCDIGNGYCLSIVSSDKELLADLYKKLGYFEDMTWRIARSLSREAGISIEKRDSSNYKELRRIYTDFDTFGHLRIPSKKKATFRVFGALRGDLLYILRLDANGSMNH